MITTKQIAKLCGVSIGTVDRALNNRPGISKTTREKILKVSEELGYRPNLVAKSLVKGATYTVGILMFDLRNSFFSQLITELIQGFKQQGYFSYVAISEKNPKEELSCLDHFAALNVTGIVLLPSNRGSEFVRYLKQLDKPIVTVVNSLEDPQCPFIGIDDEKAIYDAVQYIIAQGYKNIIYLSPPLHRSSSVNEYTMICREAGFRKAMQELLNCQSPTVISGENYINETNKFIRNAEQKPAILCSSDIYAIRVLRYMEDLGLSAPGDFGIMGFDNIDLLNSIRPRLATVDYHIHEIGDMTVRCLLELIHNTQPRLKENKYIVHHTIVDGQTL